MRTIYVVNKSRHVAPSDLAAVVAAVNKQVSWYFSKWWGHRACLVASNGAGANDKTITLVDNIDALTLASVWRCSQAVRAT